MEKGLYLTLSDEDAFFASSGDFGGGRPEFAAVAEVAQFGEIAVRGRTDPEEQIGPTPVRHAWLRHLGRSWRALAPRPTKSR